jgi:hypothetical protein
MPETLTMIRGGGAPRIVAADDSVAMRELIALMLRSRGFDVVVASDGETALAAILSDGADEYNRIRGGAAFSLSPPQCPRRPRRRRFAPSPR